MNEFQKAKAITHGVIEEMKKSIWDKKIAKVLIGYFAKTIDEGKPLETDADALEKLLIVAVGNNKAEEIITTFKKLYEIDDEDIKKSVKTSLKAARKKVDKKIKNEEESLRIYQNLYDALEDTDIKSVGEEEENILMDMFDSGKLVNQIEKARNYQRILKELSIRVNEYIDQERERVTTNTLLESYIKGYEGKNDSMIYTINLLIENALAALGEFIETYRPHVDLGYLLATDEFLKDNKIDYESIDRLIAKANAFLSEHKQEEFNPNYSNGVLIFLRDGSTGDVCLDEDLKELVNNTSYDHIVKVLGDAMNIEKITWDTARNNGFKSNITETRSSGKSKDKNKNKGEKITITSDYSGKKYEYFRLKRGGQTFPRVLVFDIDIADENREKLNLPKDKRVILVIGAFEVEYPQENYSAAISKKDARLTDIKRYIKLLENPKSDAGVLREIVLDSMRYYESLTDGKKEEYSRT